jgi:hypothetical protein
MSHVSDETCVHGAGRVGTTTSRIGIGARAMATVTANAGRGKPGYSQ